MEHDMVFEGIILHSNTATRSTARLAYIYCQILDHENLDARVMQLRA